MISYANGGLKGGLGLKLYMLSFYKHKNREYRFKDLGAERVNC